MEAITLRELLEAVGGTLIGPAAGLEQTVSHVDTDSRNIHPGSLFIPLVGERFDGHAYINSALEGGAAGCLTQRERESYREDRFYIKVKDTQRALRDLAAWYKDRFPIPFVGVTGSVGKTTAKDMIAAVLGVKYKVLKTEGNFNNNIGLPLTLLKLVLKAARLKIALRYTGEHEAELRLSGAATFLKVPALSRVLDEVKPGTTLHVPMDNLSYVDHACMELLEDWGRMAPVQGSRLVIEPRALKRRLEGRLRGSVGLGGARNGGAVSPG